MEERYDGNNIIVLEGLEAVKKRPAMYIGSTDYRGVHHLVYEVLDNSIDETMVGYCDHIKVLIHKDNSITVIDNGRGIPVDKHPTENMSSLEVVMTKLHAGGKFDHRSYKVSGGLHGVGISVVNALSEQLKVSVRRDGNLFIQNYEKGFPVTELKKGKKTNKRGTTIKFRPDEDIFGSYKIDFNMLSERMKELAYLNGGLQLELFDERTGAESSFKFDGGVNSLLKKLNEGKRNVHPIIYDSDSMDSGLWIEFCFQYTDVSNTRVLSFCNNIKTQEGGTHLSGFKTALTRTFNSFIQGSDSVAKRLKQFRINGEDILAGLSAIINVKVPDPQFEGQTKTKLGNNDVSGEVRSFVGGKLTTYLNENPKHAKSIVERLIQSTREREAARKAKDIIRKKSGLSHLLISSKLADCRSKNVKKRELFIVEGDSAGGSAKQGRNPEFQAILPLRGKVLNIEKADTHKIIKNKEIQNLIASLGVGFGDDTDVNKLRYDKVIIMTDADIDGAHIRTLLLTFFFRQFVEIIENGHLYISQPPLYRVYKKGFEKFLSDEADLEEFLLEDSIDFLAVTNGKKTYTKKTLQNFLLRIRELMRLFSRASDFGIPKELFKLILLYEDLSVNLNSKFEPFKKYMKKNGFFLELKSNVIEDEDLPYFLLQYGRKKVKIPIDFFRSNLYRNSYKILSRIKLDSPTLQFKLPSIEEELSYEELYVKSLNLLRSKYSIQRYKGLGEMNPEQLWKTTMNARTRNLLRVTIPDAEAADRSFSMLMGGNVEIRRNFIESYSSNFEFLDI